MKTGLVAASNPNEGWHDFEKLFDAARKSDYKLLKKCLTDIRFTDPNFFIEEDDYMSSVGALTCSIDYCLAGSPHCKQDTQCVDCLKLLIEKGAEFSAAENVPEVNEANVFYHEQHKNNLKFIGCNKKSIYNAVKFALMHGGLFTFADADKDMLRNAGIMNMKEFYTFAKVGNMYNAAKKEEKTPDEETLKRWIKIAIGETNGALTQGIYEQDAGGGKKTLRTFLNKKSEKKVSKTPKTSAKKQAERE